MIRRSVDVPKLPANSSVTDYFEYLAQRHKDVRTLPDDGTANYARLSCLQEVLFYRMGNCLSLSLLIYIECAGQNLNCKLVAVYGHIYLYSPDQNLLYDAPRRRLLGKLETARVFGGVSCILTEEQIGSLVAYNIGTSLSKAGDIDKGTQYLQLAFALHCPYGDCALNLAINCFRLHQYDQCLAWLDHAEKSSTMVPEIQRLRFWSLLALNRTQDAKAHRRVDPRPWGSRL